MESNFYNRGQSLVGTIIVLITVGLISGGLYFYFSKQITEISETAKEPSLVKSQLQSSFFQNDSVVQSIINGNSYQLKG